MATDMVNGYIYILENTGSWVHTVDNITLSGFTGEGTDWVNIKIPKFYEVEGVTGIEVSNSGAGSSFDRRSSRRAYKMLAQGIKTSTTNAERIANFFMLDRHTSGSAAIFKRYYLIIKKDTTSYVPFIDASSTSRDYCKGVVLKWKYKWHMDDALISTIWIDWRSVW